MWIFRHNYKFDPLPTFGLSSQKPEDIEGYNARNAPFGNEAVGGGEHFSSLKEAYLKSLSQDTSLGYHRLQSIAGFSTALQGPRLAEQRAVITDMRWLVAGLALLLLLCRHFSYLTQKRSLSPDLMLPKVGAAFY